jgi:hypothetical protein
MKEKQRKEAVVGRSYRELIGIIINSCYNIDLSISQVSRQLIGIINLILAS